MTDISTQFMGLQLRNPIIAGSSGLTNTAEGVERLAQNGAGAVVLKSIFEEEITVEYRELLRETLRQGGSAEAVDYLDYQIRAENLDNYKALIADSKKRVSIPVIASVNCTYSHEWTYFAREIAAAGADALELNMFFMPTDLRRTREEQERAYFDIISHVREQVQIPIALKISPYFTDLGPMIQRLSETGINGLVLFNRFWSPDFDIEKLRLVPGNLLSTPAESTLPLRWVAIMAGRAKCDLAASTGIHDVTGVIKQLLAGAQAVQVVSTLYRNGLQRLQQMVAGLNNWMEEHNYHEIQQFRGMMSQSASADPAAYERAQFMRYYGGIGGAGKSHTPGQALNGFNE
ncbi:MAG: dihydroorotate dehydrogenase-like protein [Anaerolineae bacterium]